MTYAIYRTSMGACRKEAIRSGYASLDEAVSAFTVLKGDAIAALERDEDGHDAYDALVVCGPIVEIYTIEAAQ